MRYLFHYIPIPQRSWVKIAIGLLWIGEASLETFAWYNWAPLYLIEIIGVNIIVFISTYFAVIVGSIHLGLGIAEYITKFKRWMGYKDE